ncbi:MAG: class I SAM-dependent methyltransferase [Candidatus Omnitrophota bacterium]
MTDRGSCIICGRSDVKLIFEGRDRLTRAENKFSVVKCQNCGLIYTLPSVTPEEIKEYYPDKYYGDVKDKTSLEISKFEKLFSAYYSKLLWRTLSENRGCSIFLLPFYRYRNRCFPYKDKPGRLLDVGCGSGRLLFEQKRLGWEVFGVELGEKAASYAREVRSLNVITGELDDANHENNFFDVVNLNHVLEHLIDPVVELKKIYRILKQGGLLVLRVPNYSKVEIAIFGKHWRAYDLPRHRFHFNKDTVSEILLKADLKPVKIIYALHVNHMILSVRDILEDRKAPVWMTNFLSVENKICRGIFLPLGFLLRLIRQSSEMLVYAEKE